MKRSKRFLVLVSITALVLLTLLGSIISASAGSAGTQPTGDQTVPVLDQQNQVQETPAAQPISPAPVVETNGDQAAPQGGDAVVQAPPSGSGQTTVGEGTTVDESTQSDQPSIDCITPKGKISGTKKVRDENGNLSVKSGVIIKLSGGKTGSQVTGSAGTYSFSDLDLNKTYYVSEEVPAGYRQISPAGGSYTVKLEICKPNVSGLDFVNELIPIPKGKISGTKYVKDSNGNLSVKAGVTINLFRFGYAPQSQQTGNDGKYCFSNLDMSIYSVSEEVPAGYRQISPEEGGYKVELKDCARDVTGKDFVNELIPPPKGKISGTKNVKDSNGNLSVKAGVKILLSGAMTNSQLTASDGTYSFDNLVLGTYNVSEEVPAGYNQVSPPGGSYTIELTKEQLDVTGKDFVNELIPPPPIKGKISGTKFVEDADGNLTPKAGVKILLSGAMTNSQLTASDGTYSFDNLVLGTYTVSEEVPAGYNQVSPPGGSYTIELTKEQLDVTGKDFVNELIPGSISGHKWQDNNWNHVHEDGEPGMGGVTIELWKNGSKIDSTITSGDGSYSFNNLVPGNYTVKEVVASGMVATPPTSKDVTVVSNQAVTGIDFLNYWAYGVVSVVVYVDSNCNGVWDCSDELVTIPVTVELYQKIGDNLVPANGWDGSYQKQTGAGAYPPIWWPWVTPYPSGCTGWNNLPVDDGSGMAYYYLKMIVPPGYYALDTTERGPFPLKSAQVFVQGSCSWWHEIFLLSPEFSISGHKWEDSNKDSTHQAEEPPVGGVTIELYKDGSKIATTTTAADGSYSFTGLKDGIYTVKEIVGAGWTAEIPDDGIYEDVHVGCGSVKDLDFLNFREGSVHGYKYVDADADGQYEPGSAGFGGVTIQLKQGDTVVQTTTTASDGKYSFSNVPPGTYDVVEVPAADVFTKAPKVISGVVVASGADVSLDEKPFLNYKNGSIHGYKYVDADADGQYEPGSAGFGGVTIQLKQGDTVVQTTTTASDGKYSFSNVPPGTYDVVEVPAADVFTKAPKVISGVVVASGADVSLDEKPFLNYKKGLIKGWKYWDKNNDKELDEGDMGLDGIRIILTLKGETEVLKETTTTEGGFFQFDGLEPGAYTISVDETTATGYYPTSVTSHDVEIESGGEETVDFTEAPLGSISGHKWLDANSNKLWDASEKALAGITIKLYKLDPSETLVDTKVTVEDGSYAFSGLEPGTYTVKEEAKAGYFATTSDSVLIDLVAGDEKTVDFGNNQYGRIEGFKFLDADGDSAQDSNEGALEGIQVTLTGQGDITRTETKTTGPDGTFFFDNLVPGKYLVTETIPAGYYATRDIKISVVVEPGQSIPVIFANCSYGKIIGNKYLDDGDSLLDTTKDKPGPGIKIKLTGTTLKGEKIAMDATTAADGSFSLLLLEAGTYQVSEEFDQTKMTSIKPSSVEVSLLPGEKEEVQFLNSETTVKDEVITNDATTLPQTGMNQLPLLIAAALMVLMGLGFLLAGRRRRLSE